MFDCYGHKQHLLSLFSNNLIASTRQVFAPQPFFSLSYYPPIHATMSTTLGHKPTGSLSQNHKAQLANAYNELGKELSSSKIRVVGNYTLGKVIGEGTLIIVLLSFDVLIWIIKAPMARSDWVRIG